MLRQDFVTCCDCCLEYAADAMYCGPCSRANREAVRENAFTKGMVVGAAIIAWAQVIRENAPRVVERAYWTKLEGLALYDDHCSDCGVQIKTLEAGQDEGTDNEWCECDE